MANETRVVATAATRAGRIKITYLWLHTVTGGQYNEREARRRFYHLAVDIVDEAKWSSLVDVLHWVAHPGCGQRNAERHVRVTKSMRRLADLLELEGRP